VPALLAWAGVVAVAALLRFRHLGWGADPIFDELVYWRVPLYSFVALDPAKLLAWPLIYPTFFGYVAGAVVGLAQELGWYVRPYQNYFGAVTIARGVSAAAGVLSVLLVGALGRRLDARAAGLVAAALLAVVPIEATQTHYVSVDVLQNVFVLVALLLGCVLVARERAGWALLGGVAAGFAFGTKYNGVIALAAPGWAVLEVAWRRRAPRAVLALGAALAAGFVLGVFLSCPPCVLRADDMLAALRFHAIVSYTGTGSYGANLTPELGWYARPYVYQLVAGLTFALGWPLYVLALLGVGAAALRRRPEDRVVLATLLAFFLVVARSPVVYPRYLLPLVPGLVACAAVLVVRAGRRRPLWIAVAVAVWLYTFALSWSLVGRWSHDQQQAVAAWVVEQTGRCAQDGVALSVAYPAAPYFGLSSAFARAGVAAAARAPGAWLGPPPDVVIVPDWLAIAIDLERMHDNDALAADLGRLRAPDGDYAPVARWSSSYLQKGFYTRLDPSFDASLEQGEIGFTAYARKALACVTSRAAPVTPERASGPA